MNGGSLETVDKFKYMGATLTKEEKSEKEIQNKIGDSKFGSGKPKYNMEKQKLLITYKDTLIQISETLYSIILL